MFIVLCHHPHFIIDSIDWSPLSMILSNMYLRISASGNNYLITIFLLSEATASFDHLYYHYVSTLTCTLESQKTGTNGINATWARHFKAVLTRNASFRRYSIIYLPYYISLNSLTTHDLISSNGFSATSTRLLGGVHKQVLSCLTSF